MRAGPSRPTLRVLCRRRGQAHRQLLRDEVRRLRMPRQHTEYFQAFFRTIFFDLVSEDDLLAWFMHARVKTECASILRLFNGPAGEDFGDFGYVLLRVSAVDAEGVKLHEFATVVFVKAAGLLSFPLR